MPHPSMRDLAKRLLEANRRPTEPRSLDPQRAFEALRASLTTFAGADGFAALFRRALAVSTPRTPSLLKVTLRPDGRLDGLEGLTPADAEELATHLLDLLEVFIGPTLTLVLVTNALPVASHESTDQPRIT